jgi:hypothetical protein
MTGGESFGASPEEGVPFILGSQKDDKYGLAALTMHFHKGADEKIGGLYLSRRLVHDATREFDEKERPRYLEADLL